MDDLVYVTCNCYPDGQPMILYIQDDQHLEAIIQVMQNNHHAQHWTLTDIPKTLVLD